MNNELKSCLNRTASRKKKVRFSLFNQIYIIPNRDQLKLLKNDPLTFDKEVVFLVNQEKKGRFMVSIIEDNSEKT
jgi:hypothetical protein